MTKEYFLLLFYCSHLKKPKNLGNKIQIGERTYGYRDLLLPDGLKLENSKTKVTEKGLAFQGEHSIFSNFHSTQVRYNGNTFPSSEHAYQFYRATYLGKTVFKYFTLIHRKKQRNLARKPALWDLVKLDRMKQIIYAKFSQNHRLKIELLKTSPSPLIEATHDLFWGCGYTLGARVLATGKWHGKNHMGIILANCRTELHLESMGQQNHVPKQALPPQVSDLQKLGLLVGI